MVAETSPSFVITVWYRKGQIASQPYSTDLSAIASQKYRKYLDHQCYSHTAGTVVEPSPYPEGHTDVGVWPSADPRCC